MDRTLHCNAICGSDYFQIIVDQMFTGGDVLTNTTDVYVDAKVNYIFCFEHAWYICLKYTVFYFTYFGLK